MNAFLHSLVAHASFAAFLLAFVWKPRVVGTAAFVVLTLTGCVEASQGRLHNAVTISVIGLLYGALTLQFWPRKEKSKP